MEFDLAQLQEAASNPVVFISLIALIVDALRSRLPVIDGKVFVGATTVGVGALLGLGYDVTGLLAFEPILGLGDYVAGLAYGGIGGVSAFLGVNVFDFLFRRKAQAEGKAVAD